VTTVAGAGPRGRSAAPGFRRSGPAPRPGAVPVLRCGGVGHVPQRSLHREGIKERDGYGSERFRVEPQFAVKVDASLGDLGVLLEPASVVAKAWDHAERIGARSSAWSPRSVLVTGAGPIGLLAALMARQRGLDVHVFDQFVDGPSRNSRGTSARRLRSRASCGWRAGPGHHHRVHRRDRGDRGRRDEERSLRNRVPDGRVVRRACNQPRSRTRQSKAGA
jgi:hypothetical protein